MSEEFVWTPPGLDEQTAQAFLSLRDGIPTTANEALYRWITDNKSINDYLSVDFLIDFQTALRKDLGLRNAGITRVDLLMDFLRKLDQLTLAYLLDFMLSKYTPSFSARRITTLREILRASGAGWMVGLRGERCGLLEVMPTGVTQSVEHVVSLNSQAGSLLQNAWNSAFGINKKPSHAYYDAVRAVEVLSTPLFSPKDQSATLGKDINVLRNAPHKWISPLKGSSKTASSVEQVLSMMQLLWYSHTDRHGHEDYSDVSIEEAQAAVLLASTLVGWFSQGMLKRIDGEA